MGDETPSWTDDGALNWAPDSAQAFTPVRAGPWSPPADIHTEEPARAEAAPAATAQLWPWRIAIGAGQGLLFFTLFHTRLIGQWPGGDAYLFTALALAGLFVPLLLLECVGATALTRLLPFAGIAAGLSLTSGDPIALLLISVTLSEGPARLPLICTVLAALIVAISASQRSGAAKRGGWRGGFEVFAAWALDLRVSWLGWTAARLFALCAVTLFLAYGAGYSAAAVMALARDGSMRRLETVNIVLGVVLLGACIALASPLADPLRLAPAAQSARLEGGHASIETFDFANLPRDGARFGAEALAKLTGSLYPDIARAASVARGPQATSLPASEVGSNIALRTPGAHLPATLLARDWSPVLGVPARLSNPHETCDAWFRDLNGDGRQEILLVSGAEARWWAAVMQADEAGRWSLTGRLASGFGATLTDLRNGRFDTLSALPGWNELTVAGNRVTAATPEAGCSHYLPL